MPSYKWSGIIGENAISLLSFGFLLPLWTTFWCFIQKRICKILSLHSRNIKRQKNIIHLIPLRTIIHFWKRTWQKAFFSGDWKYCKEVEYCSFSFALRAQIWGHKSKRSPSLFLLFASFTQKWRRQVKLHKFVYVMRQRTCIGIKRIWYVTWTNSNWWLKISRIDRQVSLVG